MLLAKKIFVFYISADDIAWYDMIMDIMKMTLIDDDYLRALALTNLASDNEIFWRRDDASDWFVSWYEHIYARCQLSFITPKSRWRVRV